jgi:hypothetical protein
LPHQLTAVEATVSAVGRARAALLLVEGAQPLPLISSLDGGRLVAYDPESNLADGCAATESSGFVDVDNAPPWDTWICYVRERDETGPWQPFDRYLVSWVPPQLLEHAERAIWINPEECILWLEDLDTRISRALQSCFSLSETLVEGDAG